MAFERVVDTLALVVRVIQTLWTRDRLHGHIWAEWHALVNVSCGGQRISSFLLCVVPTVCPGVRASVHTFLTRLLHWRKLQLLVVEIIRFLTSVSLPLAREFLVQMDTVRTILLARAKRATLRGSPNCVGLVLILGLTWLLAS